MISNLLQTVEVFDNRFGAFEADCVEEVGEFVAGRVGSYEAVPTGKMAAGSTAAFAGTTIQDLTIFSINWGVPMTGTALTDHNRFCISISVDGFADTIDPFFGRISPRQDQARVFSWKAGTQVVASDRYKVLILELPMDLLEARARSYTRNESGEPLRFSPLLDLQSVEGAVIQSLAAQALSQACILPRDRSNPLIESSLQDIFVTSLLSVLDHNYNDPGAARKDSTLPRSVKLAEDYMRAHAHEPVTMAQLAREAGCSERALQSAFRSFRNKTPMTVLRDIRLEGAHADLMQDGARVADIAFKWGFSNLGRFAALYQSAYGKKPSQTVQKLVA